MKSRKQFYIDKDVQGAIVRRILYYWATCMLFLTIPLLISKTIVESDKLFYEHLSTLFYSYWPVYLVSALLLPFLIYDTLRVSHKFTGPIYHLRRELQNLLDGKEINEISFRETDHWHDLAGIVNQLIARTNENDLNDEATTPDRKTDRIADQSIVETIHDGVNSKV